MRSAYRNALLLVLAASLLAACAQAVPPPLPQTTDVSCPPPPGQPLGEHGMLAYQSCLAGLPPERLAREHDAVSGHYAQTGSGADRVKLALLLSVPGTAFHSTAAAQQMLGASAPAASAPGPGAGAPGGAAHPVPAVLRHVAQLLGAALAQQQALEDRVQSLEKELAAEKQRSDALQAQIDSVKNLERAMTRRQAK